MVEMIRTKSIKAMIQGEEKTIAMLALGANCQLKRIRLHGHVHCNIYKN